MDNTTFQRDNHPTNHHSDNYNGNTQNVLPTERIPYREQINTYRQRHPRNGIENEVGVGRLGVLRREYIWERCPPDYKCPWFLHDKPLTLLVVVIGVNWLVCLIFAQIFIEFEGPDQKVGKLFQ